MSHGQSSQEWTHGDSLSHETKECALADAAASHLELSPASGSSGDVIGLGEKWRRRLQESEPEDEQVLHSRSRAPKHPHEPLERPDPLQEWQVDFKDASSVPADPQGSDFPSALRRLCACLGIDSVVCPREPA
jgi:hypothetical protein